MNFRRIQRRAKRARRKIYITRAERLRRRHMWVLAGFFAARAALDIYDEFESRRLRKTKSRQVRDYRRVSSLG